MKRRITFLLLALLLFVPGPVPVFPQAYVDPSRLPRTYNVGFSIACGGTGDCVTLNLTAGNGNVTAIREIWISQPSNQATVSIIRRSAFDTGGTGSAVTLVQSDTNDSTANTVVTAYTAAPTPGATVGTIFSLVVTTTSTLIRDSTVANYKPILIQGTTQQIAINVNTATTMTVNLVITETP